MKSKPFTIFCLLILFAVLTIAVLVVRKHIRYNRIWDFRVGSSMSQVQTVVGLPQLIITNKSGEVFWCYKNGWPSSEFTIVGFDGTNGGYGAWRY